MWYVSFRIFRSYSTILAPKQQPIYDGQKDIVGIALALFTSAQLVCTARLTPRTLD